tara:strand:- start:137 stop:421 length:285 start_codon:yes stop_codon:yes gene_type:complete
MGGLCHAPKPDIGPDSLPLDKRGELSANAGGGTKDPPNQSHFQLMRLLLSILVGSLLAAELMHIHHHHENDNHLRSRVGACLDHVSADSALEFD